MTITPTVIVLLLLLMLVSGAGGWNYKRYGWYSFGPGALFALVLILLVMTGHLR